MNMLILAGILSGGAKVRVALIPGSTSGFRVSGLGILKAKPETAPKALTPNPKS